MHPTAERRGIRQERARDRAEMRGRGLRIGQSLRILTEATGEESGEKEEKRKRWGGEAIPDPTLPKHLGSDELWCPDYPAIEVFCAREVVPGERTDRERVNVFGEDLNCRRARVTGQQFGHIRRRGGQPYRRQER
jgi:hypothetical protein